MWSGMLFSLVLTLFSFPQVDRSDADRWFAQARAHFEKRELDESRAAAEKALQIDPQIADAEVLLGLIANLQAQPQIAIHREYSTAISNPRVLSVRPGSERSYE
jgi:tetratricopeptide (TPR) repeat protein